MRTILSSLVAPRTLVFPLALLLGCADRGATAVVVAISVEGAVPQDINHLRLIVQRDNQGAADESYELPDGARLPGTITLKPRDSEQLSGPLKISVEGARSSPDGSQQRRVFRSATLTFAPEKQKLLRMPLRFSCFDHDPCTTEGKPGTCIGGACLPDSMEAASLPDFQDNSALAAEPGAPCFDEQKCLALDANTELPFDPSAGCSFDAPASADSLNLAAEWSASPGRAVLLERDPLEGYSFDGSKVTLSPGICAAFQQKRALRLFFSGKCPAKTDTSPLCRVEPGTNLANLGVRVVGPNNSQIDAPFGAVADPSSLKIETQEQSTAWAAPDLPTLYKPLGEVYAFLPHRTLDEVFLAPVTISVPYTGVSQSAPLLLTADPGGSWAVVPGATQTPAAMTAQVEHFSFFVVVEEDGGAGGAAGQGGAAGEGGAAGDGGAAGVAGDGGNGGVGGGPGVCGDGTKDPSEECDGVDLDGSTCAAIQGAGWEGALGCTETCTLDTSFCYPDSAVPGCVGLEKNCGGVGVEDCCLADTVDGGTFMMGRSITGTDSFQPSGNDETPEHPVVISPFKMDRYEVTVGRFRQFLGIYNVFRKTLVDGMGAHPKIPGSGWKESWTSKLPPDAVAFKNALTVSSSTWTQAPTAFETKPIVGVDWYQAFAFCVWDGGRLPTEAEWEFAAAGGGENRRFPWGANLPEVIHAIADHDGGGCNYTENGNCALAPVGARPAGQGLFGHIDLAGNAMEWVLDSYDAAWYAQPCSDCANLADPPSSLRVQRGGWFTSGPDGLRAATRFQTSPDNASDGFGFRCARDNP